MFVVQRSDQLLQHVHAWCRQSCMMSVVSAVWYTMVGAFLPETCSLN